MLFLIWILLYIAFGIAEDMKNNAATEIVVEPDSYDVPEMYAVYDDMAA